MLYSYSNGCTEPVRPSSEQPPELYYSDTQEAEAKGTQEDREKGGELERRIFIASKRMVDGPGERNQVSKNQAALVFTGKSVCREDNVSRQQWISTSTSNLSLYPDGDLAESQRMCVKHREIHIEPHVLHSFQFLSLPSSRVKKSHAVYAT